MKYWFFSTENITGAITFLSAFPPLRCGLSSLVPLLNHVTLHGPKMSGLPVFPMRRVLARVLVEADHTRGEQSSHHRSHRNLAGAEKKDAGHVSRGAHKASARRLRLRRRRSRCRGRGARALRRGRSGRPSALVSTDGGCKDVRPTREEGRPRGRTGWRTRRSRSAH